MTKPKAVKVIGAGLAGCEATWQLVKRGIPVHLYEMRPKKMTPAHSTSAFAELVCSNSLRSDALLNAVGVLKQELRMVDSLIIRFADEHRVPAGSALAVDREGFSKAITDFLRNHPLVTIFNEEVSELIEDEDTIIATGPLTSDPLAEFIRKRFNQNSLYFYDAAAPILEKDSINFDIAYYKSRYDKGEAQDYINCPMTKEEFEHFYEELINAEVVQPKDFEKEIFFEGCMPFEVMAKRGPKTLTFGPMKPVGLALDREKPRPYAVVQLRQDNAAASLYNIVGFQTHLTWPEQRRIIRMIPGLENAEFARYGVMHRNTYIKAPNLLNQSYQALDNEHWYFAGQMSGVEGYVESCASGCVAGIDMARRLLGLERFYFSPKTVMGAMAYYITHTDAESFQPMNATFGLLNYEDKGKKHDRKERMANSCLEAFADQIKTYDV
jgi:methylenetetrahydrofolate--tRNA-(uracil-5-)-methyltransferase